MILNLFGGPGSGKSTGAAYIFSKLKMLGVNAELVTEFAKDKVWEESKAVFDNQLYILGKQDFKVSRCYNKVDVVVTDSPAYNSKIYNNYSGEKARMFDELVLAVHKSYDNLNYFVRRIKPYNPLGRFQTENESDELSERIKNSLVKDSVSFTEIDGCVEGYDMVVAKIMEELK